MWKRAAKRKGEVIRDKHLKCLFMGFLISGFLTQLPFLWLHHLVVFPPLIVRGAFNGLFSPGFFFYGIYIKQSKETTESSLQISHHVIIPKSTEAFASRLDSKPSREVPMSHLHHHVPALLLRSSCTQPYHSSEFSKSSSYISLKNDHSLKIWHLLLWHTVMWLNGTRVATHISTGCQHLSISVLLALDYHLCCN